jgi:hypothetical protein
MSAAPKSERIDSALTDRERWLVKEGFIAGYVAGANLPMRDKHISVLAQEWLDDSVADAVIVEMALAHEAKRYENACEPTTSPAQEASGRPDTPSAPRS